MSFLIAPDRRARVLVAGALLAGGLGLTADRADAAYTPTIDGRTLIVTGDAASDKLALRAAPGSVELDVGDDGSADFRIARARFDRIRVLAGDGNDEVRLQDLGALAATTVEGGAGFDRLAVSGSDAAERLRLGASGARARLTGDSRVVAVDTGAVERIDLAPLGGDDALAIDDLTGTAVQEVHDDLAAVLGGGAPDQGADRLTIAGTPADDSFSVLESGERTLVLGPTFVAVAHADPARDRLTIEGRAGDDRVEAGSVANGPVLLADGGAGDDNLTGSDRADTLIGGDGNDFVDSQRGDDAVDLGAGDDIVSWRPGDGADRIEGQAGRDSLHLSGSAANEQFAASASAARLRVTRDAEALDAGGLELLSVLSFGGADRLTVGDLTGTGLDTVDASLFDFGVPGGASDVVIANGTAAADKITAAGDSTNVVNVTGLPARIRITGTEPAGDRLEVNGLAGGDTIDSTGLSAARMRFRTDGGAGDDVLLGGAGDDVLFGSDDADVVFAGGGDNVAFGGSGDDVLRGEAGDDFLDGGAGDDILIGNAGDDILLNGEVVFDT